MDWCVVAGPVAAAAVQVMKRFSVVQRYPKVILALLAGGYAFLTGTGWECFLGAFATGIAGYEVIIKPATKRE